MPAIRQPLALALAALCCSPVLAQGTASAQPGPVYEVQQGDSLWRLAQRHLTGHDAMAQLVRLNQLSQPDHLRVGQRLRLPGDRLRATTAEALVTLVGCREATRQRGEDKQALTLGDAVRQGDVLSTPPGCQLGLTLSDASTVRLNSDTVTRVKTLQASTLHPAPQLELELQQGRVQGRVPRKRAPGEAPFEIRTSLSLAGIRGTEFQVAFDPRAQRSQLEVFSGRVAARGRDDVSETLVRAQEGLTVPASGRALPVEALPEAVRLLEGLPLPGERQYALRTQADPRAALRRLVWSQEANATRLSAESTLTGQDIAVTVQDGEATFLDVRGLSASGLEGPASLFGVCHGYRLQQSLRCDVRFDLSGWSRSQLRLTQVQAQPVLVADVELPSGPNDQAVLRGLQTGTYHWVLNQVLPSGAKVQSEGRFQLLALSGSR